MWAGFAELRAINAETAKGLDRHEKGIEELRAERAESSRKLDEQLAENARDLEELKVQVDKTSRRVEETSKKVAETTKTLKDVTRQMGGLANSNGDFAEEYFFNSLADTMQFGEQHYDMIDYDVRRKIKGVEDQFDVVMYNGSSVALIEVKYRAANLKDIDVLTTRKVERFRTFFPQYKDHKLYLGIASMSFDSQVIACAHDLGVGILKQKGDTLEIDTDHLKAY